MPLPDKHRSRIRIVAADDHPIFREGLVRLLQARPDLEIVGAASDGDEALALVRSTAPDILLLDMAMPRMSGLVALREMRALDTPTRIVLLTAAIERPDIVTAIQLGARAVVLKESASDVLYKCLQAVMDGQYWLGRKAVATLVAVLREVSSSYTPAATKHFGLTDREREIVGVILDGCSNGDIAAKFAISEKTVKHHLTNIFDKVGVSNRLELALFALHHKIDTGTQPAGAPSPESAKR
jgi:two-component system nitrate/nitrite response regulator NarL